MVKRSEFTDHNNGATPVAIVGSGPVGLALALGLARHGVRSVLLERKPGTSQWSKAPAIHIRTREVFRQWGIEDRFVATGILREEFTMLSAEPGKGPFLEIDFSILQDEADRPGLLILEQGETERLLLEAVEETGLCDVRFNTEVVGLQSHAKGVQLTVRQADETEYTVDAQYAVGCDGASSFVRKAVGLPFEGTTYALRPMLADVWIDDARDELSWPRVRSRVSGLSTAIRLRPGLWRIIRLETDGGESDDVPEAELREYVEELLGPGSFETIWSSRFRVHLRSSPTFRAGRVLLAGDAAHIHSPAGGLGMNAGIHDAHNLAWKLAHALRGGEIDRLLDSYDIERRAVVVETVSAYTNTLTRVFLQSPAFVRNAAFALTRLAFMLPQIRRRSLRRGTMIDLGYPESPLLEPHARCAGMRLPNLLLRSPEGREVRLYDLLSVGPTLLELAPDAESRTELPIHQVIRIGASGYTDPTGTLRDLLGSNRGWILVRPDTHIAWARTEAHGLGEAIGRALGLGSFVTAVEDLPATSQQAPSLYPEAQ